MSWQSGGRGAARPARPRHVQEHLPERLPLGALQHRQQTAPDLGQEGEAAASASAAARGAAEPPGAGPGPPEPPGRSGHLWGRSAPPGRSCGGRVTGTLGTG